MTLGEKVDNLVGKVSELTTVLSGEAGSFGALDSAVTRLGELLAERDILMVIDDVWDPAHLQPFLQGGPHCARLITTRNLDTLPDKCSDIKVDSMQSSEAAELLGKGLPAECRAQIIALAERVGNWPLLLGIVKGVLLEREDRQAAASRRRSGYHFAIVSRPASNPESCNTSLQSVVPTF